MEFINGVPIMDDTVQTTDTAQKPDLVSHPSHYNFGKYEVVKVIIDWGLGFCLGNVIKYVARAGRKDGNSRLQDLMKAKQYLEFEIEAEKAKEQTV